MSEAATQKKIALADHLRRAVLTLELRPGSDLDETQLSKQFGLYCTPLREVLRELVGEGYLEARRNKGMRVAEMSHQSLRAFFQAAPMLYNAITQLAAENATEAQIETLKDVQLEFRAALASERYQDRAMFNTRFHEITGEMAHNPYLLPSFRRLLIDHTRIGMTFFRPRNEISFEKLVEAADQHDRIIEAIQSRNARLAGKLAEEHWALSRNGIELYVMPAGLDVPLGAAPWAAS